MKTHTLKLHEWIGVFLDRGAAFDPAGPYVVSTEGPDVTVDVEHAAYPKRPETRPKGGKPVSVRVAGRAGIVSDAVAAERRATCLDCEHHGEVAEFYGHCRKKGEKASCPGNLVTFRTSPVSRCPLSLWPA